jgi:hypothetical protein
VSARLTPSKRELLVLARTSPQPDDASALGLLTASLISLGSMRAAVPRIDVPDVSRGGAPPVCDISAPVVSTASEYLLADLGCGVVGAFSLATGQLVRELRLNCAALGSAAGTALSALQVFRVGAGRTLVAAAALHGQAVCVVELGLQEAAQQAKAERDDAGRLGEQHQGKQVKQQQQPRQQQRPPSPPQPSQEAGRSSSKAQQVTARKSSVRFSLPR